MKKVTLETIKESIRLMDEINGSNHYDNIDWDNPTAELPAFLIPKEDDKKD